MTIKADPLRARGSDVAALTDALHYGGSALEAVPHMVKAILDSDGWRHFVTKLGKEVRHESFETFVATPPLAGLGTDVAHVRRVIVNDISALILLNKAIEEGNRPGRRTDLVDNINKVSRSKRPTGTARDQALRRLRKDAPDLLAAVKAGDLSPHAAMVKAGFRRKTITIPVDSAAIIVSTLRRRLDAATFNAICQLLETGGDPP